MLGLAKRKPRKRRRPLWDSTSESTCIDAAPPSSGWQKTARCSAPSASSASPSNSPRPWPPPGPSPRWCSSPPMAGTGRPMFSKTSAPTCTSPTRSATTGGTDASRTTCATPRTWPPCWRSGASPRAGSRRPRSESCASWCAIAIRSSGTGPVPRPRSTGSWPRTGSCPSSASCGDRPVRPSSTVSSSPRPMPCASTLCATCSTSTRRPSPSSTRTSTPSSRPTPAIGPS